MSKTQFDIEHVLKLEAIFNNPLAGLVVLDRDAHIESANEVMRKELGQNLEDLEGIPIARFLDSENQRLFNDYLKHCLEKEDNNEKPDTIEIRIKSKSNQAKHVELGISETRIQNKLFFIGIIKDITPEKTLQQKIEQQRIEKEKMQTRLEKEQELNDLKNRFVSMASHEFRAPLAGLLSSVNLIERYTNSARKEWEAFRYHTHINKHLDLLKRALHNLQGILNEFLSVGQLEAGKLKSHPQTFKLDKFLKLHREQVLEIINPPQKLDYQCVDCNLEVHMDKNFLHNILNNLISNAKKYSPDNSTIKVKLHVKGDILYIAVEDQGKGIPKDQQSRIFDHFFRAENVANLQGTGLGLTITRKYVELMHGKLSFESQENNGSVFYVELPFKKV